MRNLWKQVRYRLEYFGCRLLAGLIPRLPRRGCLRLAKAAGTLYYRFDRRTRAVALENLRLAFGDTLDAATRERVARASFLTFARAMLDLFWARNLTPQNYTRYLKLEGFEHAYKTRDEHGSIIFLAIHHGGQEWVHLTGGFTGFNLSFVALDFKNPALESVFRKAREHSGNHIIGQQQSMLKLLRAARRGDGGAGLLIDLALRLNHPGVPIDAFGMKMYVTFLHALLHTRTGVPMIPVTSVPHEDGTCTVTAHPPLTFPPETGYQEITQACWDFFEPFIRERPDLWLWNYKHWRYRPTDSGREYPFYAHTAKKFDQAVQAANAPQAATEKTVGL